MRFFKPLGALASLLLVFACYRPWVFIASRNLTITGMDTTGTNFGKPGLGHIVFTVLFLALIFIPRIWSRRLNLFFMAFNVAWGFRNLLLIPACSYGECPQKLAGIYALPVLSCLMLLTVMLAPEKMPESTNTARE